MGSIISVLYFIVLMFFIGYSLTRIFKLSFSSWDEAFFMRMGFGLAAFPLLTTIFSWVHLLHWGSLLVIALAYPLYELLFGKVKPSFDLPKFGIKKKHISLLLLLIIFAVSFSVMHKGAFTYPYLEDGDPLHHAVSSKYISETHSYNVPDAAYITHYLEPYPPFYSGVMGVMLQLADNDVYWTLKFFNALLVSLSVLFMYYLVHYYTQDTKKALVAAFLLAIIPSFISHFIFAAAYATMLVPVGLYVLFMFADISAGKGKKAPPYLWLFGGIIFSGLFLIQPTISALFLAITGLFLLLHIKTKAMKPILFAILAGLLLAQLFWIPATIEYGVEGVDKRLGFNMFDNTGDKNNDSSGGAVYGFKDFWIAPSISKMDQPTGLGQAIFIAFFISLAMLFLYWNKKKIFSKEQKRRVVFFLLWVVFLFIGLESNLFPIKFTPHRLWAFFAIGVVLFVTWGMFAFTNLFKQKEVRWALWLIFVVAIIWTAAVPKYTVQTSYWPPGPEWSSQEELQGYLWMQQNLPKNTPVFSLCYDDRKAISANMLSFPWDLSINEYRKTILERTPTEVHQFVKGKGYQYVAVDAQSCIKKFGLNETQVFFDQLSAGTAPFLLTQQVGQSFFLLEIV